MGLACDFLDETEFDFVVVGTGAGGGTVASRLAEAGNSVLVLEAGIDKGSANEYQMPIKHAAATETPGLAWNFFVDHYTDSRSAQLDSKMTPKGIMYPRGGTLGGSTAINAMITVLPQQSDWDRMAVLTKDESWMASNMNKFEVDVLDSWLPTGVPPLTDLLGDWLDPDVGLGTLVRLLLVFDSVFDEMGVKNETLDGDKEEEVKHLLERVGGFLTNIVEGDNTLGKLTKYARFLLKDVNDKLREGNVEGAYAFPQMIRDGHRHGSRERLIQALDTGKLTILTGALASRVIFSNAKAGGGCDGPCRAKEVVYLDGQGLYGAEMNPSSAPTPADSRVRVKDGGEVILSAGAFNTPQLLKQSGIGPKSELQDFDIPIHVDLAGVGENLQDRYEVGLETQMFYKDTGDPVPFVDPEDCNFAAVQGDLCYKHWTENGNGLYSTNGAVISMLKRSGMRDVSDLHIFGLPGPFRGYVPGYSAEIPKTTTRNKFTWAILQGQTDNRGGTIKLRCTDKTPSNKCKVDPRATPDINFHYYNEGVEYDEMNATMTDSKGERDLEAMVRAIELVRRVQNRTAKKLESTPYFMKETWPGDEFAADERFGSESKKLREFAKREAWGHHASCTAPMGCIPANEAASHTAGAGICKAGEFNKNTVLDSRFRVRGTQGLRVVDASAFPRIPGTFLLLPTFIMSEKGAATILEDREGRWPSCPGAFAKDPTPNRRDNCECRDGLRCYEGGNSGCSTSWTKLTGLKSSSHFSLDCYGCRCTSD